MRYSKLVALLPGAVLSFSFSNNLFAAQTSGNAMNPAISMILDGRYAPMTNNPGAYYIPGFPLGGEAGLDEQGLYLSESELAISGNIDDMFYGNVTTSIAKGDSGTEIDLEQAYIETSSLANGVNIRVGQMFSGIGYMNEQHAHTWDFTDPSLAYRAMLANQYKDTGVQLRYILPTDLFAEIGAEVFRGASYPAAGPANEGTGTHAAFLHLGGDVGYTQSWLLGASALWTKSDARSMGDSGLFSGDSTVTVFDAVWKWAPNGNAKQRQLKLQAEYLARNEKGDLDNGLTGTDNLTGNYTGKQSGYYVQAAFRFLPRWRTALRYDRLTSDNSGDNSTLLSDLGLANENHTPQRISAMLEYTHSEFSLIRLQVNQDRSNPATDKQIFLQYQVSIGAHGAHQF